MKNLSGNTTSVSTSLPSTIIPSSSQISIVSDSSKTEGRTKAVNGTENNNENENESENENENEKENEDENKNKNKNKNENENENENLKECPICFEEPDLSGIVITTCGHMLCLICAKMLINKNKQCPICLGVLGESGN